MTLATTLPRTRNSNAVAWKARRMAAGGEIRAMDLFSGCGGLSLGFHREGFSICANLEFDKNAARSHALNFHGPEGSDRFELHAQARDITKIHPLDIARELGMGDMERAVDVIIGGPPCQAYSRVGRAKLLNLAGSYEAYLGDSRRTLFQNYLTYVEAFKPLALLMENVPDILNQSGDNIMEGIANNLGELGYDVRYTILNSAFYGVPQTRDRAFLMAFRREMGVVPSFPEPTCHFVLPHGYQIARKHTMRHVTVGKDSAFVMLYSKNDDSDKLTRAVTAEDALDDLPFLEGVVHTSPKRVKQENELPYRNTDVLSDYATLMRSWKGF